VQGTKFKPKIDKTKQNKKTKEEETAIHCYKNSIKVSLKRDLFC
jgi:hypothetical protein